MIGEGWTAGSHTFYATTPEGLQRLVEAVEWEPGADHWAGHADEVEGLYEVTVYFTYTSKPPIFGSENDSPTFIAAERDKAIAIARERLDRRGAQVSTDRIGEPDRVEIRRAAINDELEELRQRMVTRVQAQRPREIGSLVCGAEPGFVERVKRILGIGA